MNEGLNLYREKMSQFQEGYYQLEADKMQTLQDAVQRMVIFDTNCDMNNKYDTKGYQQLVDALDKDAYLEKIKLDVFNAAGKYSFVEKDEI